MTKHKGFKSIVVLLIIVFAVGAFLLLISNIIALHYSNKKHESKAADLTISNYDQLVSFANSVNSGNSYEHKTVVLSNSINCEILQDRVYWKQDVPCIGSGGYGGFKGTFDGQGYSIYNFTLKGCANNQVVTSAPSQYTSVTIDYYYQQALFVNTTGTIKNLRVYNFEFSTITRQTLTPGGRVTSVTHTESKHALVSNYTTGGTVQYCWLSSSSDYKNVSSAHDIMLSGSIVNSGGGVISSVNSSSGLTSCGGGSGTSGTTWYYNSEYNGGWPKLRVFIKNWTTISFVSSDTSKGTVSPVSIQVPSDADSSKFDDANNSTSTTITIYSQSVTATPKVGCGLEKWEYNSSSKTYTARFKNRTYILGFKAGINTEQTASYGSYCYVGEQYSVTYNTEVTISLISNVKQGYGAVRISFVDAGGHTRSMIYSALPGYYINSYSICNQNKTGSLTYKVTTTGIIEVSAVLKTYDLEFN